MTSVLPMKRIILHIGTEKTGSTTLQRFLGTNRRSLAGQGYLYATSPSHRYNNHVKLAAYAAQDEIRDDLRTNLKIVTREDLQRFRTDFRSCLSEEVRTAPPHVHTLILSSEHCHSRLRTREATKRLADLLNDLADEVIVLVYLRRQDEMATSLYSTGLRHGRTDPSIFPKQVQESNTYYNLYNLLERWAAAFGRDALRPRIYSRQDLTNGDVISDFLQTFEIEEGDSLSYPPRLNESFTVTAQEVVRAINQWCSENGVDPNSSTVRETISRIISSNPGPGRRPSRARAMEFYHVFERSNEQLKTIWFPERAALFSSDFDRYPEEDDLQSIRIVDAVDVLISEVIGTL